MIGVAIAILGLLCLAFCGLIDERRRKDNLRLRRAVDGLRRIAEYAEPKADEAVKAGDLFSFPDLIQAIANGTLDDIGENE